MDFVEHPEYPLAGRVTVLAIALVVQAAVVAPVQAREQPPAPVAEATSEAAENPGFFLWTDTSLSLLPYGGGYEVDPDRQTTLTVEHAHESKIGDLFLFVDFNKYHNIGGDDTNWYGEIGPRMSFGKVLDRDLSGSFFKRSLFEIKDVLLAAQYERGEDPGAAEAILLGVGFDLDVRDRGILGRPGKFNYVQLNVYGRSNLAQGADDGFNDVQVTMVASYPFKVGKYDFLLDGYFDWVLGLGDDVWSYHLNPQLTMDLGATWNYPRKLYVGVEIDFWWNKYQIADSSDFNTDQYALSLLMKHHF